jgi:DNA-binding MarR family transcriptional regulator
VTEQQVSLLDRVICASELISLCLLSVAEIEPTDADLVRAGCDLRVALGRIVRRLRQDRDPGEPTMSEVSVLAQLDRHGAATPGVLADRERVRPQAMGATLAVLERRALVERATDPTDGRRVVLSITDAGRRILVDRRSRNAERMTSALSHGFSPAEQRRLIAIIPLLERMADLL